MRVRHNTLTPSGWQRPIGCLSSGYLPTNQSLLIGLVCGKRPAKIRHETVPTTANGTSKGYATRKDLDSHENALYSAVGENALLLLVGVDILQSAIRKENLFGAVWKVLFALPICLIVIS